MSGQPQKRVFRVNPVECVIFCLVCVGFGFSIFHLFRETGDFEFTALKPMASQPTNAVRAPASMPIEVSCADNAGMGLKECENQAPRPIEKLDPSITK